MSCGCNKNKSCHDKSCQRCYNNSEQAFIAGQTIQLAIEGAKVVDSGISIETQPLSYVVQKTGLYHIAADAVINATTAGTGTLTVYMDGVALPCTIREITCYAGNNQIHTETDLQLTNCCCDIDRQFTFVFESGTAVGAVVQFCSGITKLA